MKAEVVNLGKENVGGPAGQIGKRLVVTCGQPEGGDGSGIRNLTFTVPYTPENLTKYAFGNVIDVVV